MQKSTDTIIRQIQKNVSELDRLSAKARKSLPKISREHRKSAGVANVFKFFRVPLNAGLASKARKSSSKKKAR